MARTPTKTVVSIVGIVTVLIIIALAAQYASLLSTRVLSHPGHEPLPHTKDRPQLLTFGMFVTPYSTDNPINPPERFTGYHTALDLELLEEEESIPVPVSAVCAGEIVRSGFAAGYGGLIVQRCTLDDQDVTVIYGHLDLASLVATGTTIEAGSQIAVLAEHKSEDSGGTRKHLHLGIHKGTDIDIRGYVQSRQGLQDFLDPKEVLNL